MARKAKLPKRIAGVKIPKRIRKGPLGQFLCSRTGQAMVAEALVIASGALAAQRVTAAPGSATGEFLSSSARQLKRAGRAAAAKGSGSDAHEFMGIATERLAYAGLEGLRAFRDALSGEQVDSLSGGEMETSSDQSGEREDAGQAEEVPDSLDTDHNESRILKKKLSRSRSESAATPA
jgi:hypothetical protein